MLAGRAAAVARLEDQGPGPSLARVAANRSRRPRGGELDGKVDGVEAAQVRQQPVVGLGLGLRGRELRLVGGGRRRVSRLRAARCRRRPGPRSERHRPESPAADRDAPAVHADTVVASPNKRG